ncbi:ABC transporter permease [Spongiactinospora sp. TRM90649]|uniref:ABC transporter permease n=1 Tax=Spongiactinospora sp. TRM90649 TaxID=3031114 RepID=UPI0023F745AF|nr:ABC transporter permease [Spongiactinospora sp. TRM90649]MDF5758040.1 ABC transporter permease [Spongiactinospora sp. TRM90649]
MTALFGRLGWAAADTWTITRRDLIHWGSRPGQALVVLLFPVMILLMFGYLFGGAVALPGGGGYREFLMPGMFAMTMLFGIETTFAAVAGDAAKGVTDRFRSMPMSGAAVVTGRGVADLLHSVLGLAVMIGAGLAVGWRWHEGPARALAAFGLLLLLRFAMLWLGIWLGLVVGRPEMLAFIQILVWPLMFVSNTLVPPETMPAWLAAAAEWNPLSATVAAIRELFGNPGWGGESLAAQYAVPLAAGWPLLMIAVFAPLAVRRYRRLGR